MVLGIDLGTSNTVASTLSRDGSPVILPDAFNKDQQSTPSIALIEGRKAYVGKFAENLFEIFPNKSIISHFKRSFGTQDPVYFDDANQPWFSETLAALILRKVKYDAEMYMPDGFNNAVITVPAHYNDVQRKSVIEAARLADLNLSGILEEPVAAALCYGSTARNMDDEIILVYDFGGGTFDLTLITKAGNQLHVIAKDGVNKLGGKEFDELVSNQIKHTYSKLVGGEFPSDKLSLNRLNKISEQVKIDLSDMEAGRNISKWLMFGRDAFECQFDHQQFSQAANDLVSKTDSAVTRCLRSLGMQLSDIHKFILIGGTSNSKMVYNYWSKKMGPHQELIYHQPLSSVAKGAALYASSLGDMSHGGGMQPIDLKSVSTYNIGLQLEGQKNIDLAIHRNTPLPVVSKKMYRINPAVSQSFTANLCQFWDADTDLYQLGTIVVPQFNTLNEFLLEVNIENRQNGTIGVKVRNADTQQDIRFEFIRKESGHKYDFQQQKSFLDAVYVNNNLF